MPDNMNWINQPRDELGRWTYDGGGDLPQLGDTSGANDRQAAAREAALGEALAGGSRAAYAIHAAVPLLSRDTRLAFEQQLTPSVHANLTDVLNAYANGPGMDTARFRSAFGANSLGDVALSDLREAATQVRHAGTLAAMHTAATKLAAAMQAIGAQRLAGAAREAKPGVDTLRQANLATLSGILHTEARGEDTMVMAAMGQTILNRMTRNGTADVADVKRAYGAPHPKPDEKSLQVARDLLEGRLPNTTQGATHYYSPKNMPREGASTSGFDVGGGLESVPGVDTGKPAFTPKRSYRPVWTTDPRFTRIVTPSVPEASAKLFRSEAHGRVR
jgi:hypothetical protein